MSQQAQKPQQFSIATLLLVTTLIAVCLALFRVSPLLGVLSLVLILPALLRTTLLALREQRFGGRMTGAEKVAVFFGSLVVVLMCLIATLAAATVVFLAGLLGASATVPLGDGPVSAIAFLGFLASVIAGGCTAWYMVRMSWPQRDDFVHQLHRGDLIHIPETRRRGKRRA